ncbi:hypothetical protein UP09_30205 [Bradyrhizobium sp. LTSP885]|nr:hypothetical protein UP09_30205 [Bradyrhizobium sp. LTSP885]
MGILVHLNFAPSRSLKLAENASASVARSETVKSRLGVSAAGVGGAAAGAGDAVTSGVDAYSVVAAQPERQSSRTNGATAPIAPHPLETVAPPIEPGLHDLQRAGLVG